MRGEELFYAFLDLKLGRGSLNIHKSIKIKFFYRMLRFMDNERALQRKKEIYNAGDNGRIHWLGNC